jgi:hypothetical protein
MFIENQSSIQFCCKNISLWDNGKKLKNYPQIQIFNPLGAVLGLIYRDQNLPTSFLYVLEQN